jgi:hypothetical protein
MSAAPRLWAALVARAEHELERGEWPSYAATITNAEALAAEWAELTLAERAELEALVGPIPRHGT